MNTENSRIALMQRVALFCALLVIAIVSISAFIRLSGAGLGCSPWPDCYGQALREQQQGIARATNAQANNSITVARLAHRLLAVLLLPLALVMAIGGFTMKPKHWEQRWDALLALALVLFLAVLGRWTSGALVPAVTLGNLLGGFLLFALFWRMTGVGRGRSDEYSHSRHARVWRYGAIAILLTQIMLGGLVSSGYAGLSCPNITDCLMIEPGRWDVLNPMREPHFDVGVLPVNAHGALVHGLHLWAALATTLAVTAVAITYLRGGRRLVGLALLALIGTQAALGMLLIHNELPLAIAVAHNAVAALLLALLISAGRNCCRSR